MNIRTSQSNRLSEINQDREKAVRLLKEQIDSQSQKGPFPAPRSESPLGKLEDTIKNLVTSVFPHNEAALQFKYLHRKDFGADLVVTVPSLIKSLNPKRYIAECLPVLLKEIDAGKHPGLEAIEKVNSQGMYINIRLKNSFLLESLKSVTDSPFSLAKNISELGKNVIVEYSAPNVAKQLHAGHIRSTIAGHVLASIHEACGATTYRLNHLNDIGGFGFLIEGWKRWCNTLLLNLSDDAKVIKLYEIRRLFEKALKDSDSWDASTPEEKELIKQYLENAGDFNTAQANYRHYIECSDNAFQNLENGCVEELTAWQAIVKISLNDFSKFYSALDIVIDFELGESFYLETGNEIIDAALANGRAVKYSDAELAKDIEALKQLKEQKKISDEEFADLSEGATKDLGAVVVRLSNNKRMVVRRSDGRSIYATRDLGAIAKRVDIFNPDKCVYVVGQEQREHFSDLFEAAKNLGILGEKQASLSHLSFGFYVDAATKKKLSSRDGAASVNQLLADSKDYFDLKLQSSTIHPAEREKTSKALTIASLVFNDLEKDIKGAVEIDISDPKKTIEKFERAGGAYVIYTACRTKALLDRFRDIEKQGKPEVLREEMNDLEAYISLLILRTADIVTYAASSSSPSAIVKHLLDIASNYSSYYSNYPVFCKEGVHTDRLTITHAVNKALVDGLRLCNVQCPDRI